MAEFTGSYALSIVDCGPLSSCAFAAAQRMAESPALQGNCPVQRKRHALHSPEQCHCMQAADLQESPMDL